MVDTDEFRRGLAETRQYLLSHHVPAERYRCYAPTLRGRTVHVCARCLGIYPGIATGLLAFFVAPSQLRSVVLVAVLPLPALVDWLLTSVVRYRGFNVVRTGTGALLGYAYGAALPTLFVQREIGILAIGGVYALTTGIFLYLERNMTSR